MQVARKDNFEVDIPAVVAAIKKHKCKLVMLPSPNNPTGTLLANDDIEILCKVASQGREISKPSRHILEHGSIFILISAESKPRQTSTRNSVLQHPLSPGPSDMNLHRSR